MAEHILQKFSYYNGLNANLDHIGNPSMHVYVNNVRVCISLDIQ